MEAISLEKLKLFLNEYYIFRGGNNDMSLTYLELEKEIKGKNINEIKEILLNKENLWKEMDLVKLFVAVEQVIDKIDKFDRNPISLYMYNKKETIFFLSIELFTNITELPKAKDFDNYNINLEMALIESNYNMKYFYKIVDEALEEKKQEVLNALYDTFNKNIPSLEETKEMKNELNNMFSEQSPENLKLIKDILAFNDPSIKKIKDMIYDGKNLIEKEINNENKEEKERIILKSNNSEGIKN